MDKSLSVFTKDENVAGFGGYIEPLESRIKGQHVWVFPDRMCRQDLHGIQIYDSQHVILLSHHEREPSGLIQCDSVRAFNAGHGVAANDPHGALAESYLSLQLFGGAKGTEMFPKVEAAASKAIEMDEQLAEAHEILARAKFSYDWDWTEAQKEFRRARELNPSVRGFPFDSYAGLLAATGRFVCCSDKAD
jgi:tetratricopeptide (TPR) repeat protein